MSACIAGNEIVGGMAQILSVTARPVPTSSDAIRDQIVITLVANGTTSQHIFQELGGQLDILATKFNCTFSDLTRFGEAIIVLYSGADPLIEETSSPKCPICVHT